MTIAAFDVHYREDGLASAAAVVFAAYGDDFPGAEYHRMLATPAAYVPGAFYRRELPGILALMERIDRPLATLIVDGYVSMGPRPGLGQHLFEALEARIPVIGVAKSRFAGVPAHEVYRGASRRPLYVTAVGMTVAAAAANIQAMHGAHRVPTLLQRVDRLARDMARYVR
jgi:deoxyribonuclease V